jgi:hypothetical protein
MHVYMQNLLKPDTGIITRKPIPEYLASLVSRVWMQPRGTLIVVVDDRPEEVQRISEARTKAGDPMSFAIDEESAKVIM